MSGLQNNTVNFGSENDTKEFIKLLARPSRLLNCYTQLEVNVISIQQMYSHLANLLPQNHPLCPKILLNVTQTHDTSIK